MVKATTSARRGGGGGAGARRRRRGGEAAARSNGTEGQPAPRGTAGPPALREGASHRFQAAWKRRCGTEGWEGGRRAVAGVTAGHPPGARGAWRSGRVLQVMSLQTANDRLRALRPPTARWIARAARSGTARATGASGRAARGTSGQGTIGKLARVAALTIKGSSGVTKSKWTRAGALNRCVGALYYTRAVAGKLGRFCEKHFKNPRRFVPGRDL